MTVTAAQLAAVAEALTTMDGPLLAQEEDFGSVGTTISGALGLLDRCWGGPLPDRVDAHLADYLAAIDGTSGAVASARGTIGRWAGRAEEISAALATSETQLADSHADLARHDSSDDILLPNAAALRSAIVTRRGAASSRVAQLSTEWATACTSFADELSGSIVELQACTAAAVGTVELRAAVGGSSYHTAMAVFALQQAMPLDVIDPTGALQAAADAAVDDFVDGEHAALQYTVVETMHEGDIRLADGDTSLDDWYDATDFTAVRYRIEMAAELAGLSLSTDELDELALGIVSTAVFTTAGASDRWSEVDDELDRDPAVMAALEAEAVDAYMYAGASERPPDTTFTEVDFVLPAEPTETDRYMEAWIAAKLAPETDVTWTLATTAWSFFVPDFSVMNPMSDDFSPLWAGVEIVGIGNPIDEAAGALRVGRRLLEGFSDAVDASEDLGDLNRVLDTDTLTDGVSEAVQAPDEVLGGTDDLLEGSDDVGGIDDDVAGGDASPDIDGPSIDPPPLDFDLDDPLEHMSDELVELSEQHVTGSGETVIGPFNPPSGGPSYIEVAEENGASYFDIGDAWDEASPIEREAANQHLLDVAIENGDTVRLSFDPTELSPTSYTWTEIRYLQRNGYVWIDDVTLAPAPGG